MAKRVTAILDEPERAYASPTTRAGTPRQSSAGVPAPLRRDYSDDFAGEYDEPRSQKRNSPQPHGLKLKLRTSIPTSIAGRIATGVALLLIAGAGIALLMLTRSFLLHDSRFMIQSPSAIEIEGNQHLTRVQLLSIFGEDVDRNIFRISLEQRQAELEAVPWVQHATVMRLLPGRIRIAIAERKPVAFLRQGSHIGLVDASGVLLDMAPSGTAAQTEPHYSFPVVSGLTATDPASTRAARMRIFKRFTADLDSSGEKISEALSEVDLSNPEDVKALIPANSSEILVHFGDDHFLERYRRFQEHLPAWHTSYPNLASVDMRYEREVVLDMARVAALNKNSSLQENAAGPPVKGASGAVHAAAVHPAAVHSATGSLLKPPVHPPAKLAVHKPTALPAKMHAVPVAHVAAAKTSNPAVPHASSASSPSASAAARSSFLAKPAAGKPSLSTDTYHPPQVPTR